MEAKDAIRRIRSFGLHHAIKDLPKSTLTVEAFNKAISLLDLEEQGLLLRLPCKVGATLYLISELDEDGDYVEVHIEGIKASSVSHIVMLMEQNRFGSDVFLTEEEARLKLEEIVKIKYTSEM